MDFTSNSSSLYPPGSLQGDIATTIAKTYTDSLLNEAFRCFGIGDRKPAQVAPDLADILILPVPSQGRVSTFRFTLPFDQEMAWLLWSQGIASSKKHAEELSSSYTLVTEIDGRVIDARDFPDLFKLRLIDPSLRLLLHQYPDSDPMKRQSMALRESQPMRETETRP